MPNMDLVTRAAQALALLQEPDFSDTDEELVFRLFSAVFDEGDRWFGELKQLVSRESGGSVVLSEVAPDEYPGGRIKGRGRYFVLTRGACKVYGHFGPYVPPFHVQS